MSKKVDSVYVHSFGWINCYQAGQDVYEWGLDHRSGTESEHPVYYGTWKEWLAERKHYQLLAAHK